MHNLNIEETQDIVTIQNMLLELENLHASFDYLKIRLASPERIRSWSERSLPEGIIDFGQVIRPETVNFRTQEPELHGLFCERIFGPVNDWECRCGKYVGFALDKVCEECLVELTESRVRRYRMGFIELFAPITHIWYFKGAPNYLLTLLQVFDDGHKLLPKDRLKASSIEEIIYCRESERPNSLMDLFGYEEIQRNGELSKYLEQASCMAADEEEEDEEEYNYNIDGSSEDEERYSSDAPNNQTFNDLLKTLDGSEFGNMPKLGKSKLNNESKLGTIFNKSESEEKLEEEELDAKEKSALENLENLTLFGINRFIAPSTRKGSEIIKAALEHLDIKQQIDADRLLLTQLDKDVELDYRYDPSVLIRRIRILESFLASEINPSWMVLTNLPVLPPTLRPLVELENGRMVVSDLNELYRLILARNQRLGDFLYRYGAPELIVAQMRRVLQDGVDALIDNTRLTNTKALSINNQELKSLTHILEGKEGRFRQSLLGKRVDYSGRSVIIVGPNLRLNECGLPYEMALELFHPFLINELIKLETANVNQSTKLANYVLRANKPLIWSILEKLARKHCILLNRAPTLHRFGVQAFNPIIVLGQAIHLHPLACTGFNADFDGDQMAVHLPLYESSQLEASTMMRPSFNILSPSNGEVILKPTQDMVIGCYYLTLMTTQSNFLLTKWFPNEFGALMAYYQKKIALHSRVIVRYSFSNAQVKINGSELVLVNKDIFSNETPIHIYKIFEQKNKIKKQFLITNVGVFIGYAEKNSSILEISDFLLETTPGRIIFSQNLKKLRNITPC